MNKAINSDTVLDLKTNLVWKIRPEEEEYTFDQAVAKFGKPDNDGFRVPTMEELETLLYADAKVRKPLKIPDRGFWSSSPNVGYAQYAWHIYFGDGYCGLNVRYYPYYVRLVRAG